MQKLKKIRLGYIIFLLISLGVIFLTVMFMSKREPEAPKYEPAPPEAPRLSSLGAIGESLDFDSEVRYYEIKVPAGNPYLPTIWANAVSADTKLNIYQAFFANSSNEASARIYLDDGKYKNSYEVKFVKDSALGLVLQYDDRYTFVPNYALKDGEAFVFSVESDSGNVTVDQSGVIRVIGVSDETSQVKAYVEDRLVDTLTITKTVKACLNMFIVAGQGNAAGIGGNIEESIKPLAGTSYTVELDDRAFEMKDLSSGREGFTPALASQWYLNTGEKSLFVQTAVSDVSITDWTQSGEAYKMALARIDYFKNKFAEESSPYSLSRVFCVWLHGEWDIAQGMKSDEYIYYFNDFYNGLKENISLDMTVVIPVRASLTKGDSHNEIAPVCSAQYMLGNIYEDLRIITRIPDNSNVENGMVGADNLYYTQKGYNEIGRDTAFNLFNCYSSNTDKSVRKIEVFGNTHEDLFEYGETIEIEKGETIRTVAVVSPLYAETTKVNVSFDSKKLSYSNGGIVEVREENDGTVAEMLFSCGGIDFRFNIKCIVEKNNSNVDKKLYTWEFDDLNEISGLNNLTLSKKSLADQYSISDGVLTSANRQADFNFTLPVELKSDFDWSIEWTGVLYDNSIILGNSFSTKGYIYLAPFAQNMGYSIRLVEDNGQTFYLPYGDYAEQCRVMNSWMIEYIHGSKTIALRLNGTVIAEIVVEKTFSFNLTNLFGRYGSDNVNYCYSGSIDELKITFLSPVYEEQG
ncbi:MAG: hypothetical protein IKU48_02560 [Clostridia bacterium]|nr:hypothetical protein [Clostridia bacterium]